ncbi:MAG: hypothetical protein MJ135_03225 [Oscillospiraceae bacterium]|nr:hypothetical protein [Oscillospiraceae bacterium]
MKTIKFMWLPCLLFSLLLFTAGCGTGQTSADASKGIDYSQTEVRMVLQSEEDLQELERYSNVMAADLRGSNEELVHQYMQAHPQVSVQYTVTLASAANSAAFSSSTSSMELQDASLVDALIHKAECFEQLKMIQITDPAITAQQYFQLKDTFPHAFICYSISNELGTILPESAALDLTGLQEADFAAAYGFIAAMPNLSYVRLTDDNNENRVALQDAVQLATDFPAIDFDYRIDLYGQNVSICSTQLIFNLVPIGNEGVPQLREMIRSFPRLNYLRLEQCGIDSAVLEDLNHEFPTIDVVWRIFFNAYSCLTDVTKILASGSVTDADTEDLKYCHRVRWIDLGHNDITNIDFVWGMPEIEVAIFAGTKLKNIEPIANCPKLEYFEIFGTNVTDISPLASCPGLEHFNFSFMNGLTDVSVLLQLTNLKRVWCGHNNVRIYKDMKKFMEMYPDCEVSLYNENSTGNGWRYERDGVTRVPRYELLAQQFGYDEKAYSWW